MARKGYLASARGRNGAAVDAKTAKTQSFNDPKFNVGASHPISGLANSTPAVNAFDQTNVPGNFKHKPKEPS